ncbi:MAG: universal stress protein [Anaerolineaceae bacterium]|nr:universal stress protein [Anaerolineaceae bacterium]
MKKNKLLVPLDGSAFSQQIIPYVVRFWPAQENELVVLRVGKPPVSLLPPPPQATTYDYAATPGTVTGFGMNMLLTQPPRATEPAIEAGSPEHHVTEDQAEDGLKDALADELHDNVLWPLRHAGYDAFIEVRFGDDPADEIVEYVNEEAVDLIAMATHGRSGLSKLLHGSVAQNVLQNVSIPVMLLPVREEDGA